MKSTSSFSNLGDIRRVQTDLLFGNSQIVVYGQLVTGTMIFIYLWGKVPNAELWVWVVALAIPFTLRILLNNRFRRYRTAINDQHWCWLYASLSLMSGCAWGLLSTLSMSEVSHFYLVLVLLSGVTTSAMMTSAVYLPASLVFVAAVGIPVLVTCLSHDDAEYQSMFYLAAVYLAFVLVFLRSTHRSLMESIRLRYENEHLMRQLRKEKEIANQAMENAEHENFAKSKFLAAASHDLRQPLHALGLLFDGLKLSRSENEKAALFNSVDRSIRSLSELLDGLLDISKLDAKAIEYTLRPVDVNEVIQHLVNELSPEAIAKGLKLHYRPCHYIVETDPVWLDRILRNLLSNAVRYTIRGRILVACRKRQERIVLQVWDTGMGIPASELDTIFIEFEQLHNPHRDRNLGVGLGLSIVKRLCDLLGHALDVKSKLGRGSVFSVSMPLSHEKVIQPSPPVALTQNLNHKTILVIDDEPQILDALRILLTKWGCEVITAMSGAEAINHLKEKKIQPDVIISDYRLRDGETGVEAIEAVNALIGGSMTALIITGDTSPARLKEIQESGYRVLHKPVNPPQLRMVLNKVCGTNNDVD